MVLPRKGVRPRPPPTITSKPEFPGAILVQAQPDVVHLNGRAVVLGGGDGDLELAWQERKFGMQGRPLANDFAPDAWILDLVGRDAAPLVGGDVANAVAAGLHAMHADLRQVGHGVGQFLELDPVELDVLPRGEVTVILVIAAGDVRQHAQLLGRQRAVGNCDAQHIGVELQIDAIHQP